MARQLESVHSASGQLRPTARGCSLGSGGLNAVSDLSAHLVLTTSAVGGGSSFVIL